APAAPQGTEQAAAQAEGPRHHHRARPLLLRQERHGEGGDRVGQGQKDLRQAREPEGEGPETRYGTRPMSATHWREGLQAAALKVLHGRPMHRAALGVLLLLAAVLRLWDLPHIPYTHDEISALIRIYPSLGETLRTGVIALDTHPPGVQVFEWAWTRLFGMGEAAVKLPFILLSLAVLLLLYRFAYAWCGANVALLLTALLATLQYTVMYGQIARPYAAGLFTTALLADQLTRFLGTGSRRALIGTAVAVVLSAYTHHFALLLAALMVLTGALWILPAQRKAYWIACGAAALAYLPNVPIFLKQLGAKGLDEWLAPPTAMWVPDYL